MIRSGPHGSSQPVNAASSESLASRAAAFGVVLTPDQEQALTRHRDEIVAWNRTTNLTGVRDPDAIDEALILDSLRLAPTIADGPPSEPIRLIDVGSGAGVPGVPLKIALGDGLGAVLLDSNGKKTLFLQHVVETLGRSVAGTQVVRARAEDAGRAVEHREAYDVAVARAVGSVRVLAELCLPLVRVGGRVLLPRGKDYRQEAAAAARAIEAVGGRLRPGGGDDGSVVVIEKTAPAPARFPRRVGVPQKRPL